MKTDLQKLSFSDLNAINHELLGVIATLTTDKQKKKYRKKRDLIIKEIASRIELLPE